MVLEGDNFANAGAFGFNKRVGAEVEIFFGGRDGDHDTDGTEEGDKDRKLNKEGENRAEGLNIITFVEIHGLKRLELAVAVAVLFYFGKLGLELFHELGLVKLTLDEGPHAELDENNKENNRKTKIADVIINKEEDISDGANNEKIYQAKHGTIVAYFLRQESELRRGESRKTCL